ncbi:MAG: hypothetical protein AAFZ52_04215 [Bacteroidota bacterium]
MLAALQDELKLLLGENRTKEVLLRLRDEALRPTSKPYGQVIELLGRYNGQSDLRISGTISPELEQREHNRINGALLELVDRILPQDLVQPVTQRTEPFLRIPDYHALSVNRHPQTQRFEADHDLGECGKFNVYYLHGDKKQMTRSLALRFRHLLYGRTLLGDFIDTTEDADLPNPIHCPTQLRGDARSRRMGIMQAIAQHFLGRIRLNQRKKLLTMSLAELLRQSPYAQLGEDDVVCVIVTINETSWDREAVPQALRNLLAQLAAEDIPAELPTLYFFFGLQYDEPDGRVAREVAAALETAVIGKPLAPLKPVPTTDIAAWFDAHPPLLGRGENGNDLVRAHFAGRDHWNMNEIEGRLESLLRAHNNGLLDRKQP